MNIINKKIIIQQIILSVLFLICCIFNEIRIFSLISYIGFITYLFLLTYRNPIFFLKYLAIIIGIVLTVNGVLLIEFYENNFLVEIYTTSKYIGSLPLYILIWYIFLNSIQLYELKFKHKINNQKIRKSKLLNCLSIITLCLYLGLFIQVYQHPAFMLGIDRFVYFKYFPLNSFWEKIDHITGFLLIFPIFSIVYQKKGVGILSIIVYTLYYIWNGNKFGPFFNLIIVFFLVYHKQIYSYTRLKIRKITKYSVIIFIFLFGFTLLIVNNTGVSLENYIWNRASQQGQLWWKIFSITQGETHVLEFGDEILGIIKGTPERGNLIGANNGIYKIMYMSAPESIIDAKLETGSRYTEAGIAALYYYFGSLGTMIAIFFIGIIFAFTINSLLTAISYNDLIAASILLRIFLIERTFLSMFIMYDFFKPLSLLGYIYLVFFWNKKPYISTKNGLKIIYQRYKNV